MTKLPTLEEVHKPLATSTAEFNDLNARATATRTRMIEGKARTASGGGLPGNREENQRRALLGLPQLPEVLSDEQQIIKDEAALVALTKGLAGMVGTVQREKDIASRKLCATIAPEYTALEKDVAHHMSALHSSMTKKFDFLDAVESTGASTTALRPTFPHGLHPRDTSGILHWAFKEMRENGHITMRDIPEAVR